MEWSSEDLWLPLPDVAGAASDAPAPGALGDAVPSPSEPAVEVKSTESDTAETVEGSVLLACGAENAQAPAVEGTPPTGTSAAGAADRPQAGRIKVACPNCSTTGLIPWDRLDSLLCCAGCWMWFRVGADGQLAAADPPAVTQGTLRLYSGNGQDRTVHLTPELVAEKRQALRRQRRNERLVFLAAGWRMLKPILPALVPIVLVAALIYAGMVWWSKPRLAELPQELDQRARLLVESWLKSDIRTLTRLAHRNYQGPTRRWAFEHPAPLLPKQFDRHKAAIDVRILRQDEASAEVEAHVDLAVLTGASEPLVMQQRWECLDGTWVFKPGNEPAQAVPKTEQTPQIRKRLR
jgi:hypothetical protein